MLFKVKHYVNFREYIVDLMADPGTLIPSDSAGSHIEYDDDSFFLPGPFSRETDSTYVASSSHGVVGPYHSAARNESEDRMDPTACANLPGPSKDGFSVEKTVLRPLPSRPSHLYMHGRSPSWTEGISSPAVRRMKVKDVSQYMIDAAKENPQLAQKLHDVLLESGVVAPPNLFTEIYPEQLEMSIVEAKSPTEDKDEKEKRPGTKIKDQDDLGPIGFLPPLLYQGMPSRASSGVQTDLKPVQGLGFNNLLDFNEITGQSASSQSEVTPVKYVKNVPVAAAAAAAAAVVASSMVAAAAKSNADSNLELPVAAAATAAAAVVVTTAAVGKQYENLETVVHSPTGAAECFHLADMQSGGDADGAGYELRGSGDREHDGANPEGERTSDRSADSTKSDVALDDVADCEIPWDEIALGERIGLGIGRCIVSLELMRFNFLQAVEFISFIHVYYVNFILF